MTLKIGDQVPDVPLTRWGANGPEQASRAAIFAGRRVVLAAVPGAFTPTCTDDHLPSILRNLDRLREAGADRVACIAVNDIFVLRAWARALSAADGLTMLADGAAHWTRAAGLDWDLASLGLGVRSQRYAMVVDDTRITHLAIEKGAAFEVSSGDAILAALSR